jgi:hypothetical protein
MSKWMCTYQQPHPQHNPNRIGNMARILNIHNIL